MIVKLSSLYNSKTTHHPKKQLRLTSSHSSFSPPPTPGNHSITHVLSVPFFSKASGERGLDTKAVRLPWTWNRTVLPESEWEGNKVGFESESDIAQSCPTLCDPMDCSLPRSSIHGIFQARVLEWVAISFSRGSSPPRDWTWVSRIVGRCFYRLS